MFRCRDSTSKFLGFRTGYSTAVCYYILLAEQVAHLFRNFLRAQECIVINHKAMHHPPPPPPPPCYTSASSPLFIYCCVTVAHLCPSDLCTCTFPYFPSCTSMLLDLRFMYLPFPQLHFHAPRITHF